MSAEVNDDLISQFMAFTGCADGERAQHYLEMANMNVEMAVGLFMEHDHSGGAPEPAAPASAGFASPQIRAPDRTQTMRLMDEMMAPVGYARVDEHHDILMNAFANVDARAALNAAVAAAAAVSDQKEEEEDAAKAEEAAAAPSLSDMFAPPTHLMHRGGGFQGARAVAKDARRWLLVNLQKDSEFSCHALNRDVWRDELVENLVREGFIFWQATNESPDGKVYAERYKVYDFPHIAIIDPRTGRLLWKKEGWTQEKPYTAEQFAEMAMDFCSRHSFDKAPAPPGKKTHVFNEIDERERKRPFLTEEEQLQAAVAASLRADNGDEDAGNEEEYEMEEDDDIEYLGTTEQVAAESTEEEEKAPSFIETLLTTVVGDEPSEGARIQLRMPDATKIVRKFGKTDSIKTVYAFVAHNNQEAKAGREFILMAGFPPKDLESDMDNSIDSCGLNGQVVTVRWKS